MLFRVTCVGLLHGRLRNTTDCHEFQLHDGQKDHDRWLSLKKDGNTKHTAGLSDAMGSLNELWIYIRHELRTKVHKRDFRMMELWAQELVSYA